MESATWASRRPFDRMSEGEMDGKKGRYGNGNKKHWMLAIKCCLLYDVRDTLLSGRGSSWDCSKSRLALFS